jgi:hypothetical protein
LKIKAKNQVMRVKAQIVIQKGNHKMIKINLKTKIINPFLLHKKLKMSVNKMSHTFLLKVQGINF